MPNYTIPSEWGPNFWYTMRCIAFNYPDNPTREEKTHAKQYYTMLQYLLPCKNCRKSYAQDLKKYSIDSSLKSRNLLMNWVEKIHYSTKQRINQERNKGAPQLKKITDEKVNVIKTQRNLITMVNNKEESPWRQINRKVINQSEIKNNIKQRKQISNNEQTMAKPNVRKFIFDNIEKRNLNSAGTKSSSIEKDILIQQKPMKKTMNNNAPVPEIQNNLNINIVRQVDTNHSVKTKSKLIDLSKKADLSKNENKNNKNNNKNDNNANDVIFENSLNLGNNENRRKNTIILNKSVRTRISQSGYLNVQNDLNVKNRGFERSMIGNNVVLVKRCNCRSIRR